MGKNYVVRLTFTVVAEVPDHYTRDDARYHLEEHLCVDNWVKHLGGQLVDGRCMFCYRTESELVREASEADVKLYGPAR